MIGNVGLPGWFVATRLRVMLKQPNSRGIPGSFGAIFSDVNRLDVCPVGYYNRRMKFVRRTGIYFACPPYPRPRALGRAESGQREGWVST